MSDASRAQVAAAIAAAPAGKDNVADHANRVHALAMHVAPFVLGMMGLHLAFASGTTKGKNIAPQLAVLRSRVGVVRSEGFNRTAPHRTAPESAGGGGTAAPSAYSQVTQATIVYRLAEG